MTHANHNLVESLKRIASDRCEGCRLSWRLDGWKHREPMPITCMAQEQRQQLRDIASTASRTVSAHTPGPWYAMVAETGGVSDQANIFSEHEVGGEPAFIADTLGIGNDNEPKLKQRRANAFLIAAAPDLLEQAKLFQKNVEYEIRIDRSDAGRDEEGARLKTITLNLIKATIAKAEGRSR